MARQGGDFNSLLLMRECGGALENIKLVLRTPHPAGGSPVSKHQSSGSIDSQKLLLNISFPLPAKRVASSTGERMFFWGKVRAGVKFHTHDIHGKK